MASAYDATETRPDPFPRSVAGRHPDPVLDGLIAPLSSAMLDLYGSRLGWRPEGRRLVRPWELSAVTPSPVVTQN